jgi:ribosomal protein S18 acetylase RimI-like enzyme
VSEAPAPSSPYTALDDPIGSALYGRQARFRVESGRIARFHPRVSVFFAHPRELDDGDWADVAALAAGGVALLRDRRSPLPADWTPVETIELLQFSGAGLDTVADPEAVPLGADDVPEMSALVAATKPGPFLPRTIELGGYLGVRDSAGRLIAMAGERMQPDGWTEISAVCTAPEARGRGLASRLIRAVGAGIRERGDIPFLHTSGDNPAQRLYRELGFEPTSTVALEIVRPPDSVRP